MERNQREIKEKEAVVKRTLKLDASGTIGELVTMFIAISSQISLHVFTSTHQFSQYWSLKNTCSDETAIVVIDFSENFTCHYNHAVQSSHFGASNNQISLHTGVAYLVGEQLSFCSISSSTKHDPTAIRVDM